MRRPLVGVHVRLGDGCYDSKRGGCKYVRSFEAVVRRLREAGGPLVQRVALHPHRDLKNPAVGQKKGGAFISYYFGLIYYAVRPSDRRLATIRAKMLPFSRESERWPVAARYFSRVGGLALSASAGGVVRARRGPCSRPRAG